MSHRGEAPKSDCERETLPRPDPIHETPHSDKAHGISHVKGEHDVAVFDFAPTDDLLQLGCKDAEDLAINVVDGRGEKQQRANHPAIAADGRPNCFGGYVRGHDCS